MSASRLFVPESRFGGRRNPQRHVGSLKFLADPTAHAVHIHPGGFFRPRSLIMAEDGRLGTSGKRGHPHLALSRPTGSLFVTAYAVRLGVLLAPLLLMRLRDSVTTGSLAPGLRGE